MAQSTDNQSNYAEALDYYEQSLAIRREVGDRAGEGTTLNNIGAVYRNQSNYAEALDYYEQSLAIRREVGDRSGEETVLYFIGEVYRAEGDYDEALNYYEQSLEIVQQLDTPQSEAFSWNAIGSLYDNELGEDEKAIAYYQEALEIAQEIGDRPAEAFRTYLIGTVYVELEQYAQALETLQQSYRLFIETEQEDRLESNQKWLTDALNGIRNNSSPTEYQQQCRTTAQTTSIPITDLCPE